MVNISGGVDGDLSVDVGGCGGVTVLPCSTAPVLSVLVPPISVSGGDQSRQSRAECLRKVPPCERERERERERGGPGRKGAEEG